MRLTTSQALIRFLAVQQVERDGVRRPFFAGMWGIFGHGNLAGIGQALQQYPHLMRFYLSRNEQAQVHAAVAYAKHVNRLGTFACTSSIGPGATNMVTGAALATINRLPVLLLPGDIFAERRQGPVLQQLECSHTLDVSVNDCFKPVSRFWDRLMRPEQLLASLPECMRVLTSPAETGAVTLCLPQDVQVQAFDWPSEFFAERVWRVPRLRPDLSGLQEAAARVRAARRPLLVAGGGVHYSEACSVLREFVEATGIPVAETQAGKGSLPFDHPLNLGALGATGTSGANAMAREADLVIGVGTRYSDFTTASNSAFQCPSVSFVNLNVCEMDAFKRCALPLQGDARAGLSELLGALEGWSVSGDYRAEAGRWNQQWDEEVTRVYAEEGSLAQARVIGMLNQFSRPQDVVICAAGSLPGDLHKLWRTRDPRGYHLEYGYSCMGYEIAAGMGVKLADPSREVYVLVGDGSFLMMSSEIATMVSERLKVVIVLLDNGGYASIGGLSKSVGSDGFGTKYRMRGESGQLDGEVVPVDYALNCRSLGATVFSAGTADELHKALEAARAVEDGPVCIVVPVDRRLRVGGYDSWWDVAVAEVSENPAVAEARAAYDEARARQRVHL